MHTAPPACTGKDAGGTQAGHGWAWLGMVAHRLGMVGLKTQAWAWLGSRLMPMPYSSQGQGAVGLVGACWQQGRPPCCSCTHIGTHTQTHAHGHTHRGTRACTPLRTTQHAPLFLLPLPFLFTVYAGRRVEGIPLGGPPGRASSILHMGGTQQSVCLAAGMGAQYNWRSSPLGSPPGRASSTLKRALGSWCGGLKMAGTAGPACLLGTSSQHACPACP